MSKCGHKNVTSELPLTSPAAVTSMEKSQKIIGEEKQKVFFLGTYEAETYVIN